MTINPTLRRYALGLGLAVLLVSGISGCTDNAEPVLPEGPQTMTGVLQPVAISLTRRGSHVLLQGGEETYYVESAKRDLRDLEGVDVVITGTVERNTDPEAYPVLVASGVTLVEMPVRTWDVTGLKLSLEAPLDWNGEVFDDGIRFTQTGSSHILFSVHPSTLTQLPVTGAKLQIAGRRAVKTSGSGETTVYVQNGRDILAFSYSPAPGSSENIADRDFNRMLRSVAFTGTQTTSVNAGTGTVNPGSAGSATSTAGGTPCGGPAGVLCPSGQYCEVTDMTDGVGRCRPLKR